MDERELIRLAQAGDLQAFEQLVKGWREQVFRIARQIVGEEEGAKDVAQMVFIRLWQVLRRYREGGSFAAYLHRITVNLAIDFCREQSRRATAESWDPAGMDALPSLPAGLEQSPSPGELQKIFEILSRRLSPKQRAAFVLREIEGIPTEEVSEILGMRQSTIRTHVQEARRILQESLRRLYPEYARGSQEKQR
ncbi:MAG: RNA polymerase sigma factor [Acidobacteria bacterium]|nr:RNA polymerase sigma factor [Acidobacteriota bacterium]